MFFKNNMKSRPAPSYGRITKQSTKQNCKWHSAYNGFVSSSGNYYHVHLLASSQSYLHVMTGNNWGATAGGQSPLVKHFCRCGGSGGGGGRDYDIPLAEACCRIMCCI